MGPTKEQIRAIVDKIKSGKRIAQTLTEVNAESAEGSPELTERDVGLVISRYYFG